MTQTDLDRLVADGSGLFTHNDMHDLAQFFGYIAEKHRLSFDSGDLGLDDYIVVFAPSSTDSDIVPTSEPQFLEVGDSVVRFHLTDSGELDYTTYIHSDCGRLEIDDDDDIEELLEGLV